MNIGPPKRELEIEPVVVPVPGGIPVPESEPEAPREPQPEPVSEPAPGALAVGPPSSQHR